MDALNRAQPLPHRRTISPCSIRSSTNISPPTPTPLTVDQLVRDFKSLNSRQFLLWIRARTGLTSGADAQSLTAGLNALRPAALAQEEPDFKLTNELGADNIHRQAQINQAIGTLDDDTPKGSGDPNDIFTAEGRQVVEDPARFLSHNSLEDIIDWIESSQGGAARSEADKKQWFDHFVQGMGGQLTVDFYSRFGQGLFPNNSKAYPAYDDRFAPGGQFNNAVDNTSTDLDGAERGKLAMAGQQTTPLALESVPDAFKELFPTNGQIGEGSDGTIYIRDSPDAPWQAFDEGHPAYGKGYFTQASGRWAFQATPGADPLSGDLVTGAGREAASDSLAVADANAADGATLRDNTDLPPDQQIAQWTQKDRDTITDFGQDVLAGLGSLETGVTEATRLLNEADIGAHAERNQAVQTARREAERILAEIDAYKESLIGGMPPNWKSFVLAPVAATGGALAGAATAVLPYTFFGGPAGGVSAVAIGGALLGGAALTAGAVSERQGQAGDRIAALQRQLDSALIELQEAKATPVNTASADRRTAARGLRRVPQAPKRTSTPRPPRRSARGIRRRR